MMRPLVASDAVTLVFEEPPDDFYFESDESKIAQILRNLISNALKFTERGEVRISPEVGEGWLNLSVRDTGIGIAPEDQDRIFQEFAQVNNAIQGRVKGTGLGLPLSRKLATLLGGELNVTSHHQAALPPNQVPPHRGSRRFRRRRASALRKPRADHPRPRYAGPQRF
jgi:signal transduction histidine kinase